MLIAIGVTPDEPGDDALALGAVLCRAFRAKPLLVHVFPVAYDYVSPGHVDAEWNAFLREQAAGVLAEAATDMAEIYDFHDAQTVMYGHRSSGIGLREIADERKASMIVVGSSGGASNGRFQVGSTADRLLHGSGVPVALTPTGYRRTCPEKIGTIVVAFHDTPESHRALAQAVRLAQRSGTRITVLTVLLRHRIYGSKLGSAAESVLISQQREEVEEHQAAALREVPSDMDSTGVITASDSPLGALQRLDWNGDEVLLMSSSRGGKIRRVFLGDMTYKLIRATPVPAIVLPRQT